MLEALRLTSSGLVPGVMDAAGAPEALEDPLFQTPSDILCPITHQIFRNPVVTAAGTIYDEVAIAQHLKRSALDPLTNQALATISLTPVYMVKSRALEFARATAHACMERVISAECPNPAQYLRRACELIEESGLHISEVPELSDDVVSFAARHRGRVHDPFLLLRLACLLAARGAGPPALAVFMHTLRVTEEWPARAAVVKRCLDTCWQVRRVAAAPAAPRADSGDNEGEAEGARGEAGTSAPEHDVHAIAHFVLEQDVLSAADFLQLLASVGLPRRAQVAVIRAILDPRQLPGAGAAAGDGAGGRAASAPGLLARGDGCADAVAALQEQIALVPLLLDLESRRGGHDGVAATTATAGPSTQPNSGGGQTARRGGRKGWYMAASAAGMLLPGAAGRLAAAGAVAWLMHRDKGT